MASATLDRSKTMKALIAGALIAVACAQPAAAQSLYDLQEQLRWIEFELQEMRTQQLFDQHTQEMLRMIGETPLASGLWETGEPAVPPKPTRNLWKESFPIEAR